MTFLPKLIFAHFIAFFALLLPASAHNYNSKGICTDADCTDPFQPPMLGLLEEDDPTAVPSVLQTNTPTDAIHDLSGRECTAIHKGIYIKGKRKLIK